MSNRCSELHQVFNTMRRYDFSVDFSILPRNGIYILFEKEEKAHCCDRIVRVGTHTGDNQLPSRLRQHFINENKDRSIFRKNIGRAILNKTKDDYLRYWELDLTTREKKEKYQKVIDRQYQQHIEKNVSNIIQENFSFVVFEVDNKTDRLLIESRLISEVSHCMQCYGSDSWLGNYSTKDKIKRSGLWLVNELYKNCFAEDEYKVFLELAEKINRI